MQKMQATGGAVSSPPPSLHSPQLAPSTIAAGSANFNHNPYNLAPIMQMGMGMNMGINAGAQFGGNQQGLHPQTQAMHQSVMRHPSPGPSQQGQGQGEGGYMGY
jgi:hypothetical protein